jgi:hypothetical protein
LGTLRSWSVGHAGRPLRLVIDAPSTTHELRWHELLARFRQPQVRYRPGFMRHWRQHRAAFRRTAQLSWGQRQKRLTRYVSKLRRLTAFSYYKYLQLTVTRVLGVSWLSGATTPALAWSGVVLGFVRVAGQLCQNPLAQLYRGDVVTLLFNASTTPRGLPNTPFALKQARGGRGLVRQSDTPFFLEVDELASAVAVLQEPRWLELRGSAGLGLFPFVTLKCYNWKYLT